MTHVTLTGPNAEAQTLRTAISTRGYQVDAPADLHGWVRDPGPRAVVLRVAGHEEHDTLNLLRGLRPGLTVLALLEQADPFTQQTFLRAGAAAAIHHDAHPDTVVALLDAVTDGPDAGVQLEAVA
jgi:DNA-binding NarL/FixJ family response regulator